MRQEKSDSDPQENEPKTVEIGGDFDSGEPAITTSTAITADPSRRKQKAESTKNLLVNNYLTIKEN